MYDARVCLQCSLLSQNGWKRMIRVSRDQHHHHFHRHHHFQSLLLVLSSPLPYVTSVQAKKGQAFKSGETEWLDPKKEHCLFSFSRTPTPHIHATYKNRQHYFLPSKGISNKMSDNSFSLSTPHNITLISPSVSLFKCLPWNQPPVCTPFLNLL